MIKMDEIQKCGFCGLPLVRASSTQNSSKLGTGTRFQGILGFKYPKIYEKRV